MSRLHADILLLIFENLDNYRDFHSCLLVNRLWCTFSVGKLWRNMWNYNSSSFCTLIACLPNESREALYSHGINISTPTSKAPAYDYASFCKVLSIGQIYNSMEVLFAKQPTIQNSEDNKLLVIEELLKMLMNRISFPKYLDCHLRTPIIKFTSLPGARDCLANLSELNCQSCTYFGFFDQVASVCRNIQSLGVTFRRGVSDGLKYLISVQKNLKYFDVALLEDCDNDMSGVLGALPDTLISLLISGEDNVPLSFISKFPNLQELDVSIYYEFGLENFEVLQGVNFPRLEVLRFHEACPETQLLINFLRINGSNLKEIHVNESNNLIMTAIATHCPNLI